MQQSLYRKWRPQTFSELKGQDVIRDTLFYALTHEHVSHAYLFCGPRGTGKTTTARLVAKVLNCLDKTNKPCNVCMACETITSGANLDVIELDAASNRGIDEIRQLRETVRFAPTQASYKVFIIDEVHMLTREAFSALLKTLEEPPSHAIFILATTEAHKVPVTIISRCQRYDFRLAPIDVLADHLVEVAQVEGLKLAPDASLFLARLAEGSFRDGLSLLEQVRLSYTDKCTLVDIEKLFGYIPLEQVGQTLSAIFAGDIPKAHSQIDSALDHGADLRAYVDQLLRLSQDALEGLATDDLSLIPESCREQVSKLSLAVVVSWLELLLLAAHEMKQSPIPRLPIDLAIAKFAVTGINLVADNPKGGSSSAKVETNQQLSVPPTLPVRPDEQIVHETVNVPVVVTLPDKISDDDWTKVIQELKTESPSIVTALAHAHVIGTEGDTLKLAVRYKMHADKINQPSTRKKIEPVLLKIFDAPLKIDAHVAKDLPPTIEDGTDIADVFEFEE